ncbi:MAG: ChrB protein [Acidobacteria bacterium]|nr:MAG: ChrB protein [Acidobacteriota bacterium]
MAVTKNSGRRTPWLLFIFQLPARKASQRVSVWRKLQKYGALSWKNSAYILPHSPSNSEKFQWLAAEVRKTYGEAWVVEVARIGGCSDRELVGLFNEARARDYEALIRQARRALRPAGRRARGGEFARFNRRLRDIQAIDAFDCPRRKEAESLLKELDARSTSARPRPSMASPRKPSEFRRQVWITRPRPEVDRVASAWLIQNFIDPGARFVFAADADVRPRAIRYDMFEGEFTHVGDQCTFEVLLDEFELTDKRLRRIAQMVHDADLEDGKYGRPEGRSLDLVFKGWAKMGWRDEEILRQGFKLYQGLYRALGA